MMQLRRNGVYVLHTLLPRIKREIDQDRGLRKGMVGWGEPWGTCAVVGNSGNLRGQRMGEQIDRHDMVLRLNNAPVAGFEDDVGRHTDISFINGWKMQACGEQPLCPCFPYGDRGVAMVTILFRKEQIVDVKRCRRAHVRTRIFVVDSMMHDLAHRTVKDYERRRFEGRPDLAVLVARSRRNIPLSHSTGLQAVLMTLGMCRKVSLYGFGTNTTQHHFYEAETPKEYADHDYEAEMLFYRDLVTGAAPINEWFPVPRVRFGDAGGEGWWGGGEEAVKLDPEVAQYRRR